MPSLVPRLLMVSALVALAWIGKLALRLELRGVVGRLRAHWAWRHGRDRASMCGVIRC